MSDASTITPRQQRRGVPRTVGVALLAILFCSTMVLVTTQTPTFTRKLIMAALNPAAVFWLGVLSSGLLVLLRFRRVALCILLASSLCLGIGSNGLVGRWAISSLEREYYEFDPHKLEPLDALIVLGGGLGSRRNGMPQLTGSGDRVMLAARLYHLGKARLLITGGDAIPEIGLPADTAEAAARVWRELGIPDSAIVRGRGANTGEELQNAKRYLAGTDAKRVGLLTSAWHMPRARRHAERNGLKVEPVPADFWTDRPPEPLLFSLVPSAEAIAFTHRAILEYLAMAVGDEG